MSNIFWIFLFPDIHTIQQMESTPDRNSRFASKQAVPV
jgi:hypothetical protein